MGIGFINMNYIRYLRNFILNGGSLVYRELIDSGSSIGVRKKFDDFFKDKSEPIIELSDSQCLIVKLKFIVKNFTGVRVQ